MFFCCNYVYSTKTILKEHPSLRGFKLYIMIESKTGGRFYFEIILYSGFF